jgi:hypothetical protein
VAGVERYGMALILGRREAPPPPPQEPEEQEKPMKTRKSRH